jgi:hypothetical protein
MVRHFSSTATLEGDGVGRNVEVCLNERECPVLDEGLCMLPKWVLDTFPESLQGDKRVKIIVCMDSPGT